MTQQSILDLTHEILRELSQSLQGVNNASLDALVEELEAARKIFCLGAGRSRIFLQAFCMRLNHLGFEAYMVGGLPCPPVGTGDLILVASGSGETHSVAAIVQQGQRVGAKVALFTARRPLVKVIDADVTVLVPTPSGLVNAGQEQSLQPMRTLFEQTFFLLCESVVCKLKVKKGIGEDEMARRHANLE